MFCCAGWPLDYQVFLCTSTLRPAGHLPPRHAPPHLYSPRHAVFHPTAPRLTAPSHALPRPWTLSPRTLSPAICTWRRDNSRGARLVSPG